MLEPYYRINEATGVSIHLLPGGSVEISACRIGIKAQQLELDKKVTGLTTLDELKNHFPPGSCLSMNLTGKGILQKQIEKVTEINPGNFTQLLPNADFKDFYTQNFISGNLSFVSVIRKSDADKWIDALTQQGFRPLQLTLGPFPVQHILPQLNVYENDLQFSGHVVRRNDQQEWTTYRYQEGAVSPFSLKVESEDMDERLILPYAGAFQLALSSRLTVIRAEVPELEADFRQVIADKKFRVHGGLILAVFFVLLLANFLVFSWLSSSNLQLAARVSRTARSTNDLQGITDEVKTKEALLKNLGWDGGINKSALADRLAALLPGDISWKEVTFNPADPAAGRVLKSPQFMDREIRIIGWAEKILPVNEWIARAKIQKWIKNIELESYTYNSELNTGQFTVMIDY